MLVTQGGRHPTEPEWRALLAEGGFRLTSITTLPVRGSNVLEALPA